MRFSRKDVWRSLMSNGVNLHNIYERTTRFLKILYQWNIASLDEKGIETVWNERRLLDTQKCIGRKETNKTTQLQIHATLQEKGKMIQRMELKITEVYFQPLNLMEFFQLDFRNTPCFLSIFSLLNGNVLIVILHLFHLCILGADNLFLSFRGP